MWQIFRGFGDLAWLFLGPFDTIPVFHQIDLRAAALIQALRWLPVCELTVLFIIALDKSCVRNLN